MDPRLIGSTRLSVERSVHSIDQRPERDPELNIQYNKFMRK